MPIISFLGCDGSGKSAVIRRLTERLRAEGREVVCGHWRPKAFVAESNESPLKSADDPHGQAPRGVVSSLLKLGWLWMNWWLGWWKGLRNARRDGFVFFDRFHADLLVDPRRYRYGGPMWAAKLACRWMPQPDKVFFLDAEVDVLLSRKQEVSLGALEHSRALYLALCKSNDRYRVIDANQPLKNVVEDVLKEICKHY